MGIDRFDGELRSTGSGIWNGRSGILGAAVWMFGLSFLISLIPVVGPFLGPIVGGIIGGRRAGHPGRAFLAVALPGTVFSFLIFAVAVAAGAAIHLPVIGAVGAVAAGLFALVLMIHNAVLLVVAVISAIVRQAQP